MNNHDISWRKEKILYDGMYDRMLFVTRGAGWDREQ